ncbi:MAG: tryptophan synthase subunit alpha [Gammaproteobacteria bacterium]|nr:tryptophan synthase subunit alpha [Gammaproteobacteria bacterium]
MSRLANCFEQLKQQKTCALIPFITAGDPHPRYTVELMHTLVSAGADIIELGVPFSDPMADGPVIQAADERALEHNVSLRDVMTMVQEFRKTDNKTPVVLMGYLNPIEIMGYDTFAQRSAKAGVDGVLVVDLPPEEADDFIASTKENSIDVIFLISPNTDVKRIELISSVASGYLYYVSLKGVTGANTLDVDSVAIKLDEIRSVTNLPLGVGFGIKDGATAKAVAKIADAVVVGSVLVKKIEASTDDSEKINSDISAVLTDMRTQMNEN